jgi:uncharacterized protein DUF6788
MNVTLAQIKAQYARLRARLGRLGWISHGYVQDRGPGAGGPCYQWTRKVKAKTVSVALSREQYEALKEAIDNWHQAQETLHRMQALILVRVQAETNNPRPCTDAPHPVLVRSQPWQARFQGSHHPGHV